jgi:hypothetical protein
MVLSDKLSEFFRVFRFFRGCKRIFNMAVYFLPLKHAFDTMQFQEIFNPKLWSLKFLTTEYTDHTECFCLLVFMVLSDKLSEFFRVFRVFRGCKRILNIQLSLCQKNFLN